MIRTAAEALQLLREAQVVTSGALIREITGEKVRGSWWSHPKGQLIFRIEEDLADSEEVLVTKLVGGKIGRAHV